jgi:hypothetical protein
MTQLVFKDDIDQGKIDALLRLIKSWNIDVTLETGCVLSPQYGADDKEQRKPLTLSVGLWKDRNITDKQLREMAWGGL